MKITSSATSATSTAYRRHARTRERSNPKQLAELAGALNEGSGAESREERPSMVPRLIVDVHVDQVPAKHTAKGPAYNVRLHAPDGKVIACSTEPLFAGCRELLRRGITGHVRKIRDGMLCGEGDIEHLAGLTVSETRTRSPELRKYQEYPIAVSRGGQKTAETPSEVPDTPPATKAAGGEMRDHSHSAAITEVIDAGA
jgi:hypothetical protein